MKQNSLRVHVEQDANGFVKDFVISVEPCVFEKRVQQLLPRTWIGRAVTDVVKELGFDLGARQPAWDGWHREWASADSREL